MKNTSIQHLAKLAALLVCLCTLGHAVVVAVEHGLVAPGSKGTYRGRPDIAAVRIDQVPVIDGHLIDEVWELVGGAETLPPNLPISTSSARFFIYCLSSLRTWISLDIFDSNSFINLSYRTAVL